jgi:hypothetical protein
VEIFRIVTKTMQRHARNHWAIKGFSAPALYPSTHYVEPFPRTIEERFRTISCYALGVFMRIDTATLKKFFHHIIFSGIFTCLSAISFSVVLDFATPELEIFKNFYYGGNLLSWFKYYAFDLKALSLYSALLLISIILSVVGLTTTILAKYFYDKASDVLKRGIKA